MYFGESFLTWPKRGDRLYRGVYHILTPVFSLLNTWMKVPPSNETPLASTQIPWENIPNTR